MGFFLSQFDVSRLHILFDDWGADPQDDSETNHHSYKVERGKYMIFICFHRISIKTIPDIALLGKSAKNLSPVFKFISGVTNLSWALKSHKFRSRALSLKDKVFSRGLTSCDEGVILTMFFSITQS